MAKTQSQFEIKASHRFARSSARKVRLVLDLIRGKYADDALTMLKYLPHRGARMAEVVLRSAMANAEDQGIRTPGELLVADARADDAGMFKRLMPRARGMAYLIRRRSCHITIGLADVDTFVAHRSPETSRRRRGKKSDAAE
jgi:large subunit ribosomal protein L22